MKTVKDIVEDASVMPLFDRFFAAQRAWSVAREARNGSLMECATALDAARNALLVAVFALGKREAFEEAAQAAQGYQSLPHVQQARAQTLCVSIAARIRALAAAQRKETT